MEQTVVKSNGASIGVTQVPQGNGEKITGKIECRRGEPVQNASNEFRRGGYPPMGYLENSLGKELAWMLRGDRYRILKAFVAALDHNLNAKPSGENRGA